MSWADVLDALFGPHHKVIADGDFLEGSAILSDSGAGPGNTIAIVGTTNHAPIGYELALRQAKAVIDGAKVRDYLLSSTHPVGRFKLVVFAVPAVRHRDSGLGHVQAARDGCVDSRRSCVRPSPRRLGRNRRVAPA